MKNADIISAEAGRNILREGIKNRYRHYHLLDRDRFPDFEYNTSRANYEPLREAFDEEFYVVRGINRNNPTIHIPSTNTLALLFTDNSYTPSRKILNTCYLFTEREEKAELGTDRTIIAPSENHQVIRHRRRLLLGGFLIIVVGLAIFLFLAQTNLPPHASELIMYRPYHKQIVPRIISVEGKVTNADIVYIVVRPLSKGEKCYVQTPVVVEKDGTWKGVAYIGVPGKATAGMVFHIRAFVNPGDSYKAIEMEGKYIFDSWPEKAELSTGVVEIVRGQGG